MISKNTFIALCYLGLGSAVKLNQYSFAGCNTATMIPETMNCQTTCMTQPRTYIQQTCAQPIHQMTCVEKPMPTIYRPQNIAIHLPAAEKKEEKPCECFEKIELSDEEEKPETLPEPPIEVGASLEDIDFLKGELANTNKNLRDLLDRFEANLELNANNFKTIQNNMKFLDEKLNEHELKINKNTEDIKMIRRELEILKGELMDAINKVGSSIPGEPDMDGVLGALEDQIKEAGGLNFGDRWRLRFKDDSNKDFFIHDKKGKGYYRFRTTGCDRIVKGIKCDPCCCDGNKD